MNKKGILLHVPGERKVAAVQNGPCIHSEGILFNPFWPERYHNSFQAEFEN